LSRPQDVPDELRTSAELVEPLIIIHANKKGQQPKNLNGILKPLVDDIIELASIGLPCHDCTHMCRMHACIAVSGHRAGCEIWVACSTGVLAQRPDGSKWLHKGWITAIYADAPARQKLMCSRKGFNCYQVTDMLTGLVAYEVLDGFHGTRVIQAQCCLGSLVSNLLTVVVHCRLAPFAGPLARGLERPYAFQGIPDQWRWIQFMGPGQPPASHSG
jgi:hypothetical protein